MSPRSEEFMAEARERLAAARIARESGFGPAAVSSACYAMLYGFVSAIDKLYPE